MENNHLKEEYGFSTFRYLMKYHGLNHALNVDRKATAERHPRFINAHKVGIEIRQEPLWISEDLRSNKELGIPGKMLSAFVKYVFATLGYAGGFVIASICGLKPNKLEQKLVEEE